MAFLATDQVNTANGWEHIKDLQKTVQPT